MTILNLGLPSGAQLWAWARALSVPWSSGLQSPLEMRNGSVRCKVVDYGICRSIPAGQAYRQNIRLLLSITMRYYIISDRLVSICYPTFSQSITQLQTAILL